MVIDTSALLALLFNEKPARRVAEIMTENAAELCMSTVNLAETLILIRQHRPEKFSELRGVVTSSGIRWIPPDAHHAELAARARHEFPINLGDCFAYALARELNDTILTLDKDFQKTDLKVVMP